jgi:hypothetical protein
MYDTLSSAYYTSNDSGLIAYWRFDTLEDLGINSGGVDDIRDLSINANHGDLEGSATLVSSGIFVSIEQNSFLINNHFSLNQNFPNPFNSTTKVKYSIPQTSNVLIKIFDMLGNEIETLVNEKKQTGNYEITWHAEGLPSGVYFYQLKSGSFIETKKMVLLR